MDFNDTPAEAAFRAEARRFLEANATRRDREVPQSRQRYEEDSQALTRAKAWQAKKAAARFAGIMWDEKWGGRGGTAIQQVIYNEEEAQFDVPSGVFGIGLGMCIPTMMAYATPSQLDRHVGPALRGEEIWCQLFSEPSAGSDLAGLRTRAAHDGDHWIVNGQKIWTSGAHYADYGLLITRTDPSKPKHGGLTAFFLDMKSPGVEVRRIRQISGTSHFCEVFFTDVRIPDAQRLGAINDGWKVALTTLMNERLAVGEAPRPNVGDLLQLLRESELDGAPALRNLAVRERLADWYVKAQGLKYTRCRTMTRLSRGETPGPEASIGKVVSVSQLQEIAAFGMDLAGQAGAVMDAALSPMQGWFQNAMLYAPGSRIAGGTDEILRNIIAERVLGLPGDVRVDKDVPFNQQRVAKSA
ncbi:acyl-CoA dehydrogenase family protein [Cupriavidus alkaliphilus]|uniref:acyl-CoA dehydrogenase family protein n=1 Tax=Cupriavidus alkaliphilus TaxID=942866 RepID=UPI00160F531E|nr:acyl-CoA dehydrogenase family protein [Cupriavidus alkaliphilus]MBB2919342.1 alkylation response protein AidB-like acyl-CoA dehydrogenase [Cupriavidus alkaliphilus]